MHLTDAYGIYPGECIFAGIVTEYPELCFSIEEADSRIIPHISIVCQEKIKRVVFMSNNTNFITYSLEYHQRFCELRIQEFWVKFGIKDGWKSIPFQKLGNKLAERSVQLC